MDPARGVTTERLRRDIDASRASISETVGELRRKVGEAMQWQTYVERHPAPILAGAVLVGLMAGRQIARGLAANGRRGPGSRWTASAAGVDAVAFIPARLDTPGPDRFRAVRASRQKLGSRVEGVVNRVIDEVADAAERALVPALVGGVQTFFERRGARPPRRPAARDHAPSMAGEGGLT